MIQYGDLLPSWEAEDHACLYLEGKDLYRRDP